MISSRIYPYYNCTYSQLIEICNKTELVWPICAHEDMDIQPKLGGVVKIHFCFSYKLDILRDDGIKFGRSIHCNPTNNTTIE